MSVLARRGGLTAAPVQGEQSVCRGKGVQSGFHVESVLRIARGSSTDPPLGCEKKIPTVSEKGLREKNPKYPSVSRGALFPREERHKFGAVRGSLLCVDFRLGLFGFPGWRVPRADRAGGCACYLAASTNPQALLLPAFLRVAVAAKKAGL